MNVKQLKSVLKVGGLGLLLFMGSSCRNGTYEDEVPMKFVDVAGSFNAITNESDITNEQESEILQDLKIIKSANVRYKVKSVKNSTAKIKELSKRFNAYISDLRFENNLYRIENNFTIKVPKHYFDTLMDSITNSVEFVEYENITTQDVTAEYIDIESRLKTKLEVKHRYEAILRNNAKTVEDILATEERLRLIQEDIESAQGRLKYFTNKVSFSTIQIDLYETVDFKEKPESYSKTFWSKINEGLKFGGTIIEGLIIGLVHIWPLLLFGTGIFLLIRKRRKNK